MSSFYLCCPVREIVSTLIKPPICRVFSYLKVFIYLLVIVCYCRLNFFPNKSSKRYCVPRSKISNQNQYLGRIANLGKVWFWICLRQFSPGPTVMKRSSWALDAYYHTHVETWLGSGWGGQLLDMWRGKVAIGGRLGRRAGGESDLESEGAQAQKGS